MKIKNKRNLDTYVTLQNPRKNRFFYPNKQK